MEFQKSWSFVDFQVHPTEFQPKHTEDKLQMFSL